MKIKTHEINQHKIAEVLAEGELISSDQDGLDLLGEVYYQHFDSVILHKESITPKFFDLRSGMAGELYQKFTNYRMKLAIVGDFESTSSKSAKDHMYETNKAGQISYVQSLDEALMVLSS